MSYLILIVEDDPAIASTVRAALTRYGYRAELVADFRQTEAEFLRLRPDLVVLDVNLPYLDGFRLCRQLRQHSRVPILFISARVGEMEQVLGLESGGDDYLAKPFHLDVLLARIRALLRRTYGEYAQVAGEQGSGLSAGGLHLDLAAGQVSFAGQTQHLTRTELRLLRLLLERAGKVVGREACLSALWDDSSFVDDNTLTVNVTRLRAKLEALGLPGVIETRRGQGYRLAPERLEAAP